MDRIDTMLAILVTTVVALLLAAPLIWVVRSHKKLTWTTAVLLGTLLVTVGLLLIADVPSRILYWFDAEKEAIAAAMPWQPLRDFMASEDYIVVRDIVANTVQGIFAVALIAGVYFWGERHRKQGRFSK